MTEGKSQTRQLPPLRLRSGSVQAWSMSVDGADTAEGSAALLTEAPFRLPPVEVSPAPSRGWPCSVGAEAAGTTNVLLKEEVKDLPSLPPWTAENVLRNSVQVLEKSTKTKEPALVGQVSPFYAVSGEKRVLVAQLQKAAAFQAALIFLRECLTAVDDSCGLVRDLQQLVERCEKRKTKSELDHDQQSWLALTEDEVTSLASRLRRQNDKWCCLQSKLFTAPLLSPVPELLKMHLPKVKSDLCRYLVQTLIRTQELIELILKLALRSSGLPSQWLCSVLHLCQTYNEILSSHADVVHSCLRPMNHLSDYWQSLRASGTVLTPVSLSRLVDLIVQHRCLHSTSMWCDKIYQPITPLPEHMCIGRQAVQWLPKVSELSYWTVTTPSPSVAETSGYQSGTNGTAGPNLQDINATQLGDLQAIFTNEEVYMKQWLKQLLYFNNMVMHSSSPDLSVRVRTKQKSGCESDKMQLALKSHYLDRFQEAVKNRVVKELSDMYFGSTVGHPGSTVFWPEAIILLVADKAEGLSHYHDDSRPAFVLQAVAMQLRMKAALSSWEHNFHQALSACSDHRCPLLLSAETTVGTKAGHLIGCSLQPLLALLPHFQHSGRGHPQDLAETAVLPRLDATLKLLLWWLDGRVHQLLALWQVGQYLLITHSDLKHLVDLLKHLSAVCPTTLGSLTHPVPLEWRYHVYLVSGWWDSINNMTAQIQNIASTSIQQFYRSCHQMAADAVAIHMPQGKLWKRKYRLHGPPSAHNTYVDEVISSVLWPVLEGVKHLSMPVQISVVSMATKAFCEAWMAHICKRKIKFSLYGAQLLRLDFLQLTAWLQRLPELSVEARQSIQALDILRRLHGASLLLMRQPRSHQRFRKTKVSPATSIADVTSVEPDRTEGHGTVEDASVSDSLTDEDFVPNKEEWLSLRVHGGPPRWHALWCLALPCD